MPSSLQVVGIGLDGLAGLGSQVLAIIAKASILIGDKRHLSYISPSNRLLLDLNDFLADSQRVDELLAKGEEIVILSSGDPLFFGLGRMLLAKYPSERLIFHPHLSSLQLAFSRIKQTWQDAYIISVHGRSLDPIVFALQKGKEKICILTDPNNSPQAIAKLYRELDLPIEYDFWVCADLGDPSQERVLFFKKNELNLLMQTSFPSLTVLILVRQKQEIEVGKLPLLGIRDEFFYSFKDRPGLMTKREVRVHVLAELELLPEQVVWDIGAGTGSVSIEIARLCPSSQVYAIEKSAMGINLINQNLEVFSLSNLKAVSGNAPTVLNGLPDPDRIFIGGSGGKLIEILNYADERLAINGRIVLALASLENLQEATSWFKEKSWKYQIMQVQISRSASFAKLTRMLPLNPVTIVSAFNETY